MAKRSAVSASIAVPQSMKIWATAGDRLPEVSEARLSGAGSATAVQPPDSMLISRRHDDAS